MGVVPSSGRSGVKVHIDENSLSGGESRVNLIKGIGWTSIILSITEGRTFGTGGGLSIRKVITIWVIREGYKQIER
jgi:hypothetical protein